MTHSHQMTDVEQIKTFVRGGNARFTLVSTKTGERVTFKVRASKDGKVHFVKVLTGPDNTSSYTFLGTIFSDGTYRHGRNSTISVLATSAKAFEWFFNRVAQGDISGVEFWHEGRCGRCGRVLTVPESIATGFGPECAEIMGYRLHSPEARIIVQAAQHTVASETGRDYMDPERPHDYHKELMTDEDEANEIQQREREEEAERMNRKLGFSHGYRPAGWHHA